jgi:hypothetical protein
VIPPFAVSVALFPAQIEEDPLMVIVGFGLTIRLTVVVVKQPKALFPVTE